MKNILRRIENIAQNEHITIGAIERIIGASKGVLSRAVAKGTDIQAKWLQPLVENYPQYSADWLLTGKGSMLREQNQPAKNEVLIPLYDGVVTAGMMQVADASAVGQPVEMINAGDWFRDATAAMRVHGDSMHPVYQSGSIVALKEVNNKRLIVFGEDYVLETDEYRVIKRLQRSQRKMYWLACSVNHEVWEQGELKGRLIHEPFDVFVDDVRRLFIVLGAVRRNYSSRIVYNQHID